MSSIETIKEAVDQLGHAWEEFKQTNDERGSRDEAKLSRLSEEIERLETALLRGPTSAGEPAPLDRASREHRGAFLAYLRKGHDERLSEFEAKALSAGSDPEGGYLVPAASSDRIVKKVFETSPIRQVASVIEISSDRLELLIDKDETATGGWVAETAARTETATPQLAKHTIPVHEQYSEPRASQKLLDDSAIDAEVWLMEKVAEKFARTENTGFVAGDGVGRPRGFLSYPAGSAWEQIEQINSGNASALTVDGLIDLQNALKVEYQGNAVWLMKRATVAAIRKLKDSQNQYLWQPMLQVGQPATLLGQPVHFADDMPGVAANALAVAYGDFRSGYQIVDRIGIRVLRDPFTAKPQVKFYTTKRVGGDVVNFEAIKLQKVAA
jgi:HK97 family phage major capsid protein